MFEIYEMLRDVSFASVLLSCEVFVWTVYEIRSETEEVRVV